MLTLKETIRRTRTSMLAKNYDSAHREYSAVADIAEREGKDTMMGTQARPYIDEVTKSLELLNNRKTLVDKLDEKVKAERRILEEAEEEEMATRGGGSEHTAAYYHLEALKASFSSAIDSTPEAQELKEYDSQLLEQWEKVEKHNLDIIHPNSMRIDTSWETLRDDGDLFCG